MISSSRHQFTKCCSARWSWRRAPDGETALVAPGRVLDDLLLDFHGDGGGEVANLWCLFMFLLEKQWKINGKCGVSVGKMENIVFLWENNGKYGASMVKQWKIWCFYGKTMENEWTWETNGTSEWFGWIITVYDWFRLDNSRSFVVDKWGNCLKWWLIGVCKKKG